MEFNEYQKRALSTAIFPNDNSITYLSLALCGEAGEIADKVKKVIRDQNGKYSPPDLEAIAMEIGDVLWYAANLANALGYDFDRVAALNLDKIISRFERGTLHGNGDNR
ncbi:MAG: nucleoside triphosphate pyrophosphohydrolase family protein [Bacteroidales bacterium]|nr:nucleoside triphosphate pyrophosphohydrolase family protein [Bacteroidales bacterium]